MPKQPFACGECGLILPDDVDQCNRNPASPVSSDWAGYVIIMNPARSEIAKRLNVEIPGNYALKVNIR